MILVVDDNSDVRETVCLVLEAGGYQTAEAANGQEAIDWLHREAAPSVILLDLTMPVMDGYQFLTAKEADPALVGLPVVVISSLNCSLLVLGHRISEFLRKPFSTGALFDAVERSSVRQDQDAPAPGRLEDVTGKEIAAERPGVGRPGQVDTQDEGASLLQAQPATNTIFEAPAAAIELGCAAQVGPDPATVEERRQSQPVFTVPDPERD
jgi:CheY-like chemotaxis protein